MADGKGLCEQEGEKLGKGKVEKRKWGYTSNDLWALKILIRMDVAWLQSQIETNDQQSQIGTRRHHILIMYFIIFLLTIANLIHARTLVEIWRK